MIKYVLTNKQSIDCLFVKLMQKIFNHYSLLHFTN